MTHRRYSLENSEVARGLLSGPAALPGRVAPARGESGRTSAVPQCGTALTTRPSADGLESKPCATFVVTREDSPGSRICVSTRVTAIHSVGARHGVPLLDEPDRHRAARLQNGGIVEQYYKGTEGNIITEGTNPT